MTESKGKKACLVYVSASEAARKAAVEQLHAKGYEVCEVLADTDDVQKMQADAGELPPDLLACLDRSEICVILLPEDPDADGIIAAAASGADAQRLRMVCVVAGDRASYPESIDDHAKSVVRVGSPKLAPAIDGEECWEEPGGGPRIERKFKTVKCQ